MAITATYVSTLSIVETSGDTLVNSSDNTVTYGLNTSLTLNAGSSAPATKQAAYEVTMSSGTATIDLTSLTGAFGATVTGSGLKVQAVKFKNKATNANAIRVKAGASNGYTFGGTFDVTLPVGGEVTVYLAEGAADVSGSVKTIDVSGTGEQVLQVVLVMG